MSSELLNNPVGALMRPTLRVAPEDSLENAAARIRENGSGLVVVTDGTSLVGMVTESSLAQALETGAESWDSVSSALVSAPTIAPYQSGCEALIRMHEVGAPSLVVVDDVNRVVGVLSATDLLPRRRPDIRPPTIGGMATPFGVYLTTGTVTGGAPPWALITTGMVMGALILTPLLLGNLVMPSLAKVVPVGVALDILRVGPYLVYALAMRLIPLSGIHAAEHQVVHAIERGEELRPEIVRRMPRVHPRCGTNLAVGASIFLAVSVWAPWSEVEFRELTALLVTLLLWRRVGSFVQYYVTTRKPNDAQVQSGIKAGKQLIERYTRAHVAVPNVWQRIWFSGLLHVLLGWFLMIGLVMVLQSVLHVDLGM